MIPKDGDHVKVLFRNGTLIEGTVVEWYGNYALLKSIVDESTMIITNPGEDIMLIKIIPSKNEAITIPLEGPRSPAEVFRDPPKWATPSGRNTEENLEEKFQQIAESADPYDDVQNQKLADLYAEKAKQEKEIIGKKLRTHYPSQVRRPEYGQFGLFKKRSPQ